MLKGLKLPLQMSKIILAPLTEMSTRNLPVYKAWPLRKDENLTYLCEPII
jgi:hypothetical protein